MMGGCNIRLVKYIDSGGAVIETEQNKRNQR
jgi:hypothetical protein